MTENPMISYWLMFLLGMWFLAPIGLVLMTLGVGALGIDPNSDLGAVIGIMAGAIIVVAAGLISFGWHYRRFHD